MTNAALKAAIVDYAKARPVFEQYKASKYSRKFLAEHEEKIALYRAAAAQSDSLLGGAKLPKMEVWGLPQQADFRRKSQLCHSCLACRKIYCVGPGCYIQGRRLF